MLRGDNGREGEPADEKRIEEQSEAVQKVYSDVQTLKDKIEKLKAQTEQLVSPAKTKDASRAVSDALDKRMTTSVDAEAVKAAERAVREHARRDIVDTQIGKQPEVAKGASIKEAKNKALEAQEKFAQKKREAEEKKRRLEEAERIEAEMKVLRQKAEIQAEINTVERTKKREEALSKQQNEEKRLLEIQKRLEREKEEALAKQRKREALIQKEREKEARRIAAAEEKEAKRIAAAEEKEAKRIAAAEEKEARRIAAAEEKEAKRIAAAEEKEIKRLAAIEKRNEEARQRGEAQKKKEERERLIAEQRDLARRKRAEEKQRARLRRQQQDARKAEDKKIRKARIKKERAEKNELRRQRRIARKSAEMGGGIVRVHGTTVQTEILPVSSFSIRDLFGIAKKKEITAASTEEERKALLAENERIKAEARLTAAQLAEMRRIRRANHPIFVKGREMLSFCDKKKKPLLIALTVVLLVAIGTSAVFNNCTAYEYSYAGQSLGFVKNKDDVLQITEMVQTALTEEKKIDIEINPRDDISFKRVYTLNKDITIDTSDDVLKRLTYMGDVNVKAYGIYIDGQKVGAVKNKNTAANVLKDIMNRYTSKKEGTEVKKAETIESVEVRKSNTPLGEMMSEEAMVEKLCTDSVKETVHTVVRGETLESIATDHKLNEKQILKDNEGLSADKIEVGSTIILKEMAPLMTVRITEVRTYEEKVDYETIKKKDEDLYEGYTEVDQKGVKGLSDLKDRTVSINGEVVQTENLENKVKEEPTDKIVRVGTKERPPTVGSGTYIWPANDGTYTVTSEFKWRWGRQHQGIDMGCRTGNDVLAADGGTVIHAGYMGGYGNLVIIDHQNGIKTYYAHNSALLVHVGSKVFQGQHIAEAGNTGNSFGSHIHFGVMDHGTFKNPRNYLPKK